MRRGSIRLQYNSPVVLTFALLSLAALALDRVTGGWTTRNLFSVYRCSLKDTLAYPRFVLHVLGHTGFIGETFHFCRKWLHLVTRSSPEPMTFGGKHWPFPTYLGQA